MTRWASGKSLLSNDIALIKLTKPFTLGAAVNRILVIKDYEKVRKGILEGKHFLAIAAGWGAVNKYEQEHEIGSRTLKAVEQKLLANNVECENPLVDETYFCAWSKTGGTCKDDAGGPLFINYYNKAKRFTKILLGVISGELGACEDGVEKRGIFTDISRNCQWIARVTKLNDLCVNLDSLGEGQPLPPIMAPDLLHKQIFCTLCPVGSVALIK